MEELSDCTMLGFWGGGVQTMGRPGDAVDGLSVAGGLLPDVHLEETDPKAVEAPDEIQQPPLSHNATTCSQPGGSDFHTLIL